MNAREVIERRYREAELVMAEMRALLDLIDEEDEPAAPDIPRPSANGEGPKRGGQRKVAKRADGAPSAKVRKNALSIATALSIANRPLTELEIMQETELAVRALTWTWKALGDGPTAWFRKTPGGAWELTPLGRQKSLAVV